LNPEIEDRILTDHPDQKMLRGTVVYWNFLPPDELNILLMLAAEKRVPEMVVLST